MKILIIGQGGREHAIAWKISQNPKVEKLFCAPGNAGMEELGECVPIAADQIEELEAFASENKIDLTLVGPEAPLAAGITDLFKAAGLRVFGPDGFCSRLEASKVFAKEIMDKAGVPTAAYGEFSDADAAMKYLEKFDGPVVVKADGLAAGKGVTVAQNREEAVRAVREAMVDKIFGEAGAKVIIEEFLEGEEASLIAVSDGEDVALMASSQDHKRIFEGDRGPNTGGMGAYSPAPVITDEMLQEAKDKVFLPVVRELKAQGHPFMGFLYAGIMVTAQGMRVLEFNVRFGDPEAQAVLPRMKSDFLDVIEACLDGRLKDCNIEWDDQACVSVVLASAGYPASSHKGDVIEGIDAACGVEGAEVFHAGTKNDDDEIVTAGGRVLNVTASGEDIAAAVGRVYEAVSKITFDGMQYRKDIAHRALSRTAGKT